MESRWSKYETDTPLNEMYVIGPNLGRGGSGFVYACRDKRNGKSYALKNVPLVNEGRFEMLEMELEILEKISAEGCIPNLTCLHEIIKVREVSSIYIILELVDGYTLSKMVGKRIGEKEFFQIAYEIFKGLNELHTRGIPHRDMKTENVMFNENEFKITIIDLGHGCIIPCKDGFRSGTRIYFPPEFYAKGLEDPINYFAVDMFATGLMLFELFVGKEFGDPPYEEHEIAKMKTTQKPAMPISVPYDLARNDLFRDVPDVKFLIKKLLNPDPAKRFTVGKALRYCLERKK